MADSTTATMCTCSCPVPQCPSIGMIGPGGAAALTAVIVIFIWVVVYVAKRLRKRRQHDHHTRPNYETVVAEMERQSKRFTTSLSNTQLTRNSNSSTALNFFVQEQGSNMTETPNTEIPKRASNNTRRSTETQACESDRPSHSMNTRATSETSSVICTQPEKKSKRKHSYEKCELNPIIEKGISVEVTSNAHASPDLSCQTKEVIYAMPEKKQSDFTGNEEDSDEHPITRNDKVVSIEIQNSTNPRANSLHYASSNVHKKKAPSIIESIERGFDKVQAVVSPQPQKKSTSVRDTRGHSDSANKSPDVNKSLSLDGYALRNNRPSSDNQKFARGASSEYEDVAIGEQQHLDTNGPRFSPEVSNRSSSPCDHTKATSGFKRYRPDQIDNDEGPLYTQSMKKVSGCKTLNTLSSEEQENDKAVQDGGFLIPEGAKCEDNKSTSGYEEIQLGGISPPQREEKPRMPPGAFDNPLLVVIMEKRAPDMMENSLHGEKIDHTHEDVTGRQEDELHYVAEDCSVYARSTKSISKEAVSFGGAHDCTTAMDTDQTSGTSGYEDIRLGEISMPSRPQNETQSSSTDTNLPSDTSDISQLKARTTESSKGRNPSLSQSTGMKSATCEDESSGPAYAISAKFSLPIKLPERSQSFTRPKSGPYDKELRPKRKTVRDVAHRDKSGKEDVIMVTLGTPGIKKPSIQRPGECPTSIDIPTKSFKK
ncbi:uncharacterized protein [Amphiura filiformis]|uniref:uncharacterized protein n=1 Tax=Amphiura filiformis TaxID=82378 RepID=UPI003B2241B1